MIRDRLEERGGLGGVAIDAQVRHCERSQPPSPHRSLVVSGGAPALVAFVAPLVVRVSGSKAAQSQTREQVTRASVNHGALLLGIERAARQGDGQELVRSQRRIVSPRAVNHVKAATHGRAPEAPEVRSRLRRHVFILGRGLVDGARKFRRAQECVVPERVHLHGLADSRRDHPVPGLGVHPRQLHARRSCL